MPRKRGGGANPCVAGGYGTGYAVMSDGKPGGLAIVASGNALVIEVLRVVGLHEEEPAFGEQAGVLDQRRQQ